MFLLDNVVAFVGYGLNRCLADVILPARFYSTSRKGFAFRGYHICDHKKGDMLWRFMHPSLICDHSFEYAYKNASFSHLLWIHQL